MSAIVDKNVCVGCGLCVEACPVVFEMKNSVAVVRVDPVPVEEETMCRKAAAECPVDAISLG